MTYDLESQVGTIYQATTAYEKGLYRGEQIRKVGDDVLDVKSGSYSTCSLDHPHYHFQSKWMKIYLKDKLVAKPVVFYVKNVPLLALPFYVFPHQAGRHSGSCSRSSSSASTTAPGSPPHAGYYWAPNDYMTHILGRPTTRRTRRTCCARRASNKLLYVRDRPFHRDLRPRRGAEAGQLRLLRRPRAGDLASHPHVGARVVRVEPDYQKSTPFRDAPLAAPQTLPDLRLHLTTPKPTGELTRSSTAARTSMPTRASRTRTGSVRSPGRPPGPAPRWRTSRNRCPT